MKRSWQTIGLIGSIGCLGACKGDDLDIGNLGTATAEGSTTSASESTGTTQVASDTTSSSGVPEPSDTSAESSEDSSAGPESSSSDTGVAAIDGYQDCANLAMDCPPGEVCVQLAIGPEPTYVCSQPGCEFANQCPLAPEGSAAQPSCIDGGFDTGCILDCSNGECPDGMVCVQDWICAWPYSPQGGGVCPDADLGDVMPQTFEGDVVGLFDDVAPCGSGVAEDAVVSFSAAVAGQYRARATADNEDIAIVVQSMVDCATPDLGCDVPGEYYQVDGLYYAAVQVELEAGQSHTVAIEVPYATFPGNPGNFTLEVEYVGVAMPGGDCCVARPEGSCSVTTISECVVAQEPACADAWDDWCVYLAELWCLGDCT